MLICFNCTTALQCHYSSFHDVVIKQSLWTGNFMLDQFLFRLHLHEMIGVPSSHDLHVDSCQSQAMHCSGPCSVNVRTALRGAMYLSLYLYNHRIRSFSWQTGLVLGGHPPSHTHTHTEIWNDPQYDRSHTRVSKLLSSVFPCIPSKLCTVSSIALQTDFRTLVWARFQLLSLASSLVIHQ